METEIWRETQILLTSYKLRERVEGGIQKVPLPLIRSDLQKEMKTVGF